MLLMLEIRPEKPCTLPKEAYFFCRLNGSSSQAFTAGLTGAAFEEMKDLFSPLFKTKNILRWCSSEAFLDSYAHSVVLHN